MTDKDLALEVRLQASRTLNDELRAENTRLREACEAASNELGKHAYLWKTEAALYDDAVELKRHRLQWSKNAEAAMNALETALAAARGHKEKNDGCEEVWYHFLVEDEYVKSFEDRGEVVPPFLVFQRFEIRNGVRGYLIPCQPSHPDAEDADGNPSLQAVSDQ